MMPDCLLNSEKRKEKSQIRIIIGEFEKEFWRKLHNSNDFNKKYRIKSGRYN